MRPDQPLEGAPPAGRLRWGLPSDPVIFCLDDSAALRADVGSGPDDPVSSLARAWQRWGTSLPDRLSGRFSFGLTDPTDGAVVLVRDPMGEVPLFYSVLHDDVVIGDTPNALLTQPDVCDDIDLEAISLRLASCFTALSRRTDFIHIRQVAPGTIVRISGSGIHETTYWRPEPVAEWTSGFDEAIECGRELLRGAVRDRIPRTGAVGVHLSGGLDSSTIAALARSESTRTSWAYCWSPTPLEGDTSQEYSAVASVAQRYDLRLRYADPGELLDAVRSGVDPLLDPPRAWLLERGHSAHASAHGVSTILTGWGGDEALSLINRRASAELLRRGAVRHAWHASTPAPQTRHRMRTRLSRTLGKRRRKPSPYELELDAAWRLFDPDIADLRKSSWARMKQAPTVQARMLAWLGNGHLAARNASWHRGGAPFGVTYASPLQDRRVIEFALSLPPHFFTYNGVDRRIFRSLAAGYLPESVLERRKTVGLDPARASLSKALAIEYRPRFKAAAEELGLPQELLDAWGLTFAQLWDGPRSS